MGSPFTTLGLTEDASIEEIDARYEELLVVTHPDVSDDPFLLRELEHAYESAVQIAFERQSSDPASAPPGGPSQKSVVRFLHLFSWYAPLGFLKLIAVPFVGLWAATGSLVLALVVTPVAVAVLWKLFTTAYRWYRSI